MNTQCQTLITGGRVIDPENGIDEVLTLGIDDGRIVHIGPDPIPATRVVDATGLIVAPGFIDLHSHAQNVIGHLLQAFDGITTSLELECGAAPLSRTISAAQAEGRALNYGYSASWLIARAIVMEGLSAEEVDELPLLPLDAFGAVQGRTHWAQPASKSETDAIIDLVSQQLDDGAIGIGVLLGYAPRVDRAELEALAELAARRNAPLFVHARFGSGIPGHPAPDSVAELVRLCETTGAQIHICHFASSNSATGAASAEVLATAVAAGLPMTTESYPFEFASTVIGADFLSPEILEANGTPASTITYLPGDEVVPSYERLAELRTQDPAGLCLIQYYGPGLAAGVEDLLSTLDLPGAAFASDAMPLTRVGDPFGREALPTELPVPDEFAVHPRSTSCFMRAITWLHRDTGRMDLSEVIARSTTIPATILRPSTPAFLSKGHLALGADADIVIFDLEMATARTASTPVRPADGVVHLFVNGNAVIDQRQLSASASGCPSTTGNATNR